MNIYKELELKIVVQEKLLFRAVLILNNIYLIFTIIE
jgi:hypothetical protein